jgi:hypothetical protein
MLTYKGDAEDQGDNMAGGDKDKEDLAKIPSVNSDKKDDTIKPFFIVLEGKGKRRVIMS